MLRNMTRQESADPMEQQSNTFSAGTLLMSQLPANLAHMNRTKPNESHPEAVSLLMPRSVSA